LAVGNGKQRHKRNGTQPVMELPGGEKLLSGWVAEIEEQGVPLFGVEAAKGVGERLGTRNLKRGRGGFQNGLGDLKPEGQFPQEKNLRANVRHQSF
jgi:hypothetical protein